MKLTLLLVGILIAIEIVLTCPPPTLPPNSTWVPSQDCKTGNVYETVSPPPRKRCHCWGRCGYICEPSKGSSGGSSGGGGGSGGGSGGGNSSPCKYGGVWNNPKGERCICQSFNKQPYYECGTSSSTAPASTNSTTPVPA